MVAAEVNTGKVLDKLYLEVKHDVYRVTGKALEINGINLAKHNKKAVSVDNAVGQIVDFIKKNFKGNIPVTPVGHNLPFDEGFVKAIFEKANAQYGKFISYQYIDTMPVLRLLASLGIVPDSACKLQGAKTHFGIQQKRGAAHNAIGDAEATTSVLAKLAELLSGDKTEPDKNEEEAEEVEEKPKKKRGRPKKKAEPEPEPEEDEGLSELDEDDDDEDNDEDDDDDDDDLDVDDDDLDDDVDDDDEEW
jgi:DNA polymerase III epsilon subunit-like protein